MNDDATLVTDELGSVKRLNNRPKILALLGVGVMLLIILYGFAQLDKRNNQTAESDEEAAEVTAAAEAPLDLQETAVDGVIPAERPVPTTPIPQNNVPVTIPDAQGNIGGAPIMAGASPEEEEQLAAHRAAMRQAEMDAELERKRYYLELGLERERNARDTDKLAASSPMNITLGANVTDNLLLNGSQGQGGAENLLSGVPGGERLTAGLGIVGQGFANPAGQQAGFAQPVGLPGTENPQTALLKALTAGGAGGSQSVEDANRQSDKRAFTNNVNEDEDYLGRSKLAPISPYEIKQGTIIPGVMVTGINSDLPGRIVGQVSQNVYDTSSGAHMLIPQGTRIFGRYDSSVTYGQNRVLIVWTRLIFPSGEALNIANMAGSDQAGQAGLRDKTNRHLLSMYSQAILLSAIGGGIDALTDDFNQNFNPITGQPTFPDRDERIQRAIRDEFGDNLNRVTAKVLDRGLDRQPTLTIRPGKPFVILVDQDFVLEPYGSDQR